MSLSIVTETNTLRQQLIKMGPEIGKALPSHIKPEKFQRVVMTVVQQTPDLLTADRQSLLASCMKCAADGLVPDGRDAALVIFNTKNKSGGWEKKVQYMPMIGGLLKRARNSGEIAGIVVNVVHRNDQFVQAPDNFDRPIQHQPPPLGEPRGEPIGAYALVKLRDGTLMHEVMGRDEIERVRAVSRSKDSGPWVQWWDQMARKTVFRRLSKYLPMDAEAEGLVHRDEEADRPEPATLEGAAEPAAPARPASKLDALEGTLEGEVVDEAPTDEPPTPLATLIAAIEAAEDNAAVDAALRAAKDQIGAMDPDQRKQLETAVTAQRHGFAQRSAAPAK
jgi:recombination protein RecT